MAEIVCKNYIEYYCSESLVEVSMFADRNYVGLRSFNWEISLNQEDQTQAYSVHV